MKLFQILAKVLAIPALLISTAFAQAGNASDLISTQSFVFKAQTMSPASGSVRQLTTDYYTVSISKDNIISDLPYFGRAYSAPIDPTQGGLQFKSKNFDYSVQAKKKRWEITIKTNDVPDAAQFYLTVYQDGTAYLQVSCVNRQPVSFNGVIEEKK